MPPVGRVSTVMMALVIKGRCGRVVGWWVIWNSTGKLLCIYVACVVYMCIYVHMCMYMCICIYIYMCVCVCVCARKEERDRREAICVCVYVYSKIKRRVRCVYNVSTYISQTTLHMPHIYKITYLYCSIIVTEIYPQEESHTIA